MRMPADSAAADSADYGIHERRSYPRSKRKPEKNDEDAALKAVIDGISTSPQFTIVQYPERAVFLSKITKEGTVGQIFSHFVAGLRIEYDTVIANVSKLPFAVKYCALQTQWIQRIREIIEAGERLAQAHSTLNAYVEVEQESELPGLVAFLSLNAFGDTAAQRSTLFAVIHTVARQVFMYQQSIAMHMKLSGQEDEE